MTVWAYRDGILAADQLMVIRSHRDGYMTKIRKHGTILAAVEGGAANAVRFLDWFSSGLQADKAPDMGAPEPDRHAASGFLFMPKGPILEFSRCGWTYRRALYYAGGCGSDYAYGAMAAGATAEEAVRAALIYETDAGGPIDILSHH